MAHDDPPGGREAPSELEPALRPAFPTAAIGGGAGSDEALERILGTVQLDRLALLVLPKQQRAEELAERLRSERWQVVVAEDGQRVEPGKLYVVRAGQAPRVRDGALVLDGGEHVPDGQQPVLDSFFRSLAQVQGVAAIAVVLSGAGTDGALGMREVNAAGGITFVQDPASAQVPEMPRSGLRTGIADFALPPEQIGEELTRISRHAYVRPERAVPPETKEGVGRLLQVLRSSHKVDFTQYKTATLARRIERRMALKRLDHIEDYLKVVLASEEELALLHKDLLINVTSFFRDRDPFERLKQDVFPRLLAARQPGTPIRVWVPGCASGEEAYSIAICLLEVLGDRAGEHQVQIFATDVDDDTIAEGRLGIFLPNIEVDVSPDRLGRFFTRRDRHYQIVKQIRDMVVFAGHNLTRDPPFSRIDLISCRNVLIYMQSPLQKKVLRIFHYSLNPGGWLLLGNSEVAGEVNGLFTLVDRKAKLYLKRNVAAAAVFDLDAEPPVGADPRPPLVRPAREAPQRPSRVTVQQLADRKVLERYGPPGVLVNENLEVLQFRGKIGHYLEPVSGGATLNLLKLARPELVLELRTALSRAFAGGEGGVSGPIRYRDGEATREVKIEVLPVLEPGTQVTCALVLFDAGEGGLRAVPPSLPAQTQEGRVDELERELGSTKEYLQSVITELETTNEEMQSSNEELQSANEELQSTNEQLQTSKEELQSANEELATVNEELQNRMVELGQFKDDLLNVINGVGAPVVLVGMDMRVRYVSPPAAALFGLSGGDVGRPLGNLLPGPDGSALERVVWDVIQSLQAREHPMSALGGQPRRLRVIPYRSSDQTVQGAVISLLPPGPAEKAE